MIRTFLTEKQINDSTPASGLWRNLARTLTAPMPQVLLVVRDPDLGEEAVYVRTAVLGPLSWGPYTKAIPIPRDDEKVARGLRTGAQCVLGLPSRKLMRQLAICRQRLPRGISEAAVARLQMFKSEQVEVPFPHDCPVNFECVIDHVEPYHSHLIAFVRVVAANIDPAYIFWDRSEIIQMYPTNFADDVVDEAGGRRMRVSLLKEIHPCPTFPLGEKVGWGSRFDYWVRDLADENYITRAEQKRIDGWFNRWQEIYTRTDLPERVALKEKLGTLCRLFVAEQWDQAHAFLAGSPGD
jgi:flavin reductase (DIM6/NTAB) family NADH-FMN oxidoreductase RutF